MEHSELQMPFDQVPTPATQTGPDINVTTSYDYTATGLLASMTRASAPPAGRLRSTPRR